MSEPNLPWINTPLIESSEVSRAAGCRVFLKLDNLQPSGSFKSRGMGNIIRREVIKRQGKPAHFFSSSGGNAGIAAVTAARSLGQKCTVVVPLSTKPSMIAKVRLAGATDVVQNGASWREADAYMRETLMAQYPDSVYVPPFDHPDVYEGNSSIVEETAEVLKPGGENEPDAFICCVGGGGLFSGVAQGISTLYGDRPQILAVETLGCDSLNQSLKAGELVTLPRISSLATSLGATRVSPRTFECGKQKNVKSVVVSDADAAMGCWRFADDERTLVELACGASICLAYNGMLKDLIPNFGPDSKVVIVVCGGRNISLEMLAEYREMFGAEAEKHVTGQ